ANTPAARRAWATMAGSPLPFASCKASSIAARASSHRRSSMSALPDRMRAIARIARDSGSLVGRREERSFLYVSTASCHLWSCSLSWPSWSALAKASRASAIDAPMRPCRFLLLLAGLSGSCDSLDRSEDPLDLRRADPRMDRELEESRDDVFGHGAASSDPEVP